MAVRMDDDLCKVQGGGMMFKRPIVSGSTRYQRLKRVTYTQLKSNRDDFNRIKQAFYLDAEKCGVMQNICEKDFEMMMERLK